jgi:hypothetical protein
MWNIALITAMSTRVRLFTLILTAICIGVPLFGASAASSPSDHVVAYWQQVFRGNYESAYPMYPAKNRAACAAAGASEKDCRNSFCNQLINHSKSAALLEVGVGATEFPRGKTLETTRTAVVLTTIKAKRTGEMWRNARVNTEQSSIYWQFARTPKGWEPIWLVTPKNIAEVIPGSRAKIGISRLLRPGQPDPTVTPVSEISLLLDNSKQLEDEHERIEKAIIIKKATISWLEFAAIVLIGMTIIIVYIIRCNRRAAAKKSRKVSASETP